MRGVDGVRQRQLCLASSRRSKIAKAALRTDYGCPILDFSIFLAGSDVQALRLAGVPRSA
jgi:hypothetical protein